MILPKPTFLFLSGAIALIVATVPGQAQFRAGGNVEERPYKVESFSAVALVGTGKVIVKQTGKESVIARGPKIFLNSVKVAVVNDTLTLSGTISTEIIVTVKKLNGLSVTGTGSMQAEKIQSKSLKVSLTGTGSMEITGSATSLDLQLAGTGNFNGSDLQTRQAKISHRGLGRVVLKVSQQLDATVQGLGTVEYVGNPKVNKQVQGLGKVIRRR